MQKLQLELKNIPIGASQADCAISLSLNKAQRLSVIGKVLDCNNPDVKKPRHREGRKISVKVYVFNIDGKVLMPTTPRKAKVLLKLGNAKVVKKNPFTIQLTLEATNFTQPITLGIDSGYKTIGFSAVSDKEELVSGEVKLDNLMSKRLTERRMYRRNRRNKLWHREPRFNNRARGEGWLPPSIERRYQTHLTLIEKIKKILPISKVVIEIAKFDIQKLENPEIQGKEYQQGNMYDYQNMRSYLMSREKGLCEHCKKDFKNRPSHIHHRKPISKGGTDRSKNLMLVHEKCHDYIHTKPELLKKYEKVSGKQYKPSTFMNIINKRFWKDIPNLIVTYGNITFVNRINLGLEKTHYNDAFVIAGGKGQVRVNPFEVIQKRKNNRCLQKNRKGFAPAIRKQRYSIQPKDLVKIKNRWVETAGCHCKGTRIMVNKKSINIKLVESVFHVGTLIWRQAIPPKPEGLGFLA